VQTGLSYCAEDEGFYKEMLHDYMEGNRMAELCEMYEVNDWENYRIQVHALKSTSLSIGANELSEEARLLEQAAKDGDMEYIRTHHEKTMNQYRSLLNQLKQVL
jgi:HPt (histidine-containing phosphotransfer) domain-containing protein